MFFHLKPRIVHNTVLAASPILDAGLGQAITRMTWVQGLVDLPNRD